ncbi:MAG: helix-turn-helix transcriptional regulator [Ktedonobacteraceae bacterium]
MRADRLLSILLLLQTRGRMTARELAEHMEVSERTIYRDIEALGMAGIPVYTERGPGGGCTLLDGYQTRLTGLTEAEIRALFLLNMAHPLADLGLDKALDDALLKLSAALPMAQRQEAEQVRQRIYLDTTTPQSSKPIAQHLQTLQAAIWQDRKLALSYHAGDGTLSEQLVEPYGLVSTPQAWYLVGAVNGEKQVFCVSHLHEVASTAEAFARPTCFDLSLYWTEYCQQTQAYSLTQPQQGQQKKLCFAPVPRQTKQKKEFLNPSFLPEQKKAFNPSVFYLKKQKMKLSPRKKTAFSFV